MIRAFIDRALLQAPPTIARRYRGYKWWRWGERELHFVGALCDRQRLSIDVGANRGMYAYFMGRTSRHCLAFEPNPRMLPELRLQAVNTTIYPYALSDHAFVAELRIPKEDSRLLTGSATIETAVQLSPDVIVEKIEARTLDSFDLADIGFMKVDTEGHELSFLKGAVQTIQQSRPRLLIEAEVRHRPHAVSSVVEFLKPLGYTGYFLVEGKLEPVSKFDASVHQRKVSAGPEYICNFVFIHENDKTALPACRKSVPPPERLSAPAMTALLQG